MARARLFPWMAALILIATTTFPQTTTSSQTSLDTARRYVETGRYYEASKIVDQILLSDPGNPEAAELRARALEGLKQLQETKLREAEALAARGGASPAERLALADAYFEAGRYLTAADIYRALPETVRSWDVRLRHARALSWSGRLDEAERIYTTLLSEREDAELRLEYGRLLSWMGTSRAAIDRLRSVYEETGSEDSLEALANALAWAGRRDDALELLRAHLSANPGSDRALRLMAQIERAPQLQLERVDRLIELEPFNLALRMERARLLLDVQRYGEALRTIQFIEQRSVQPVEGLAELKQRATQGRREELQRLRAQKRELDQRNPQTADELHSLARAYAAIEEYGEAIRLYDAYLKLRPDDTRARIEYARVLSWDRRYRASQRQYERLLADNPDRADLRLEYAQVLSYDEEYVPAIRTFRALTDLSDNPRAHLYNDVPPKAHFNLGRIYRWFGWQEHAVEQQNLAINLDNGYAQAQRELDLVRHLRPATSIDARYTFFEDSNDVDVHRLDLQGQLWTSRRTAIDGWLGRHRFERFDDQVNSTLLGVGGRYRFQDRLMGWARVGASIYDEDLGTSPFWNLGAEHRPSLQSRLALEYAHYDLVYDVFTLESLRNDPIDIDDLRLHWDYNTGGFWSYLTDASYGFISDDNERFGAHGVVAFRILKSPYVAVKADGRYLSYDFRTNRYWSPGDYRSLAGVLHIGDNWRERFFWQVEGKYGKSWENDRDDRDLRAIDARIIVPLTDVLDLVGAYGEGESGRLEGIFPGDDFTTYWQRRWYVGVRVKRLFRDEERRRSPYYFEDRPLESPILPPLERQ